MNQSSSNKDKISREDFKAKYKIIPPTSIEYEKGDGSVIGDGGFGVVRKAVFNGKIVVAVKTLEIKGLENSNQNQKESIQNMALKLFLEEAKTMRQVDDHPRIVKFIGYVYETTSIVMEYVSGGSLFDYIRDNPETMTWKEKFIIAWDVSQGMAFLHSKKDASGQSKNDIFHQDLKSSNILLYPEQKKEKDGTSNSGSTPVSSNISSDNVSKNVGSTAIKRIRMRAKITDFGLSVMRTKVQEGGVVSGRRGSTTSASFFKSSGGAKNSTIGEVSNIMSNIMSAVEHNGGTQEYMAPELCTSNRKFTKACDIYAYGIILFELITMQHPIYVSMFLTCPEGISLTSEFSNSDASTPCCSQKLAALGKECVETFAKLRPRFKVIFLRLDELLTPKNAHLFDAGANNDLNYIPFKMPNPGSDEEFQPRSVNEKSFFQYSSFATNGAVPVVASENNNAGEINGGGGKIGNGKTAHVVGSAVEALKRKNTAASKVKPLACCVII